MTVQPTVIQNHLAVHSQQRPIALDYQRIDLGQVSVTSHEGRVQTLTDLRERPHLLAR
jgi:hypothetical protein